MEIPAQTLEVAKRRVDALLPDSLYGDTTAAYARKAQLEHDLVARGTSAVAQAELRLLSEALDSMEHEMEQEARSEQQAENAWLIHAERSTPEDEAFERYEAERGLI